MITAVGNIARNNEEPLSRGFRVLADDNFHFMDEDERTCLGEFSTYEEALAVAQRAVEAFFEGKGEKQADEIYDDYISFGDDPFIVPFGGAERPDTPFSAWDYAKGYAERIAQAHPPGDKPPGV